MSTAMRKEMGSVKVEMAELRSMFRRTMVTVAQMKGNLKGLRDYARDELATKADISALNSRMDGFSGLLLDSRQRWAVHADTLKQHHDRLAKLEERRA